MLDDDHLTTNNDFVNLQDEDEDEKQQQQTDRSANL